MQTLLPLQTVAASQLFCSGPHPSRRATRPVPCVSKRAKSRVESRSAEVPPLVNEAVLGFLRTNLTGRTRKGLAVIRWILPYWCDRQESARALEAYIAQWCRACRDLSTAEAARLILKGRRM